MYFYINFIKYTFHCLQLCLHQTLCSFNSICKTVSLPDLLQEVLVKNLPHDHSDNQRVVIRRKHVWEDAIHQFRKGIDPTKYFKITFVGKAGIDDGGPLREFFSLLINHISLNVSLFCGPEGKRVPTTNVLELNKNTYYHVGMIIALSMVVQVLIFYKCCC